MAFLSSLPLLLAGLLAFVLLLFLPSPSSLSLSAVIRIAASLGFRGLELKVQATVLLVVAVAWLRVDTRRQSD